MGMMPIVANTIVGPLRMRAAASATRPTSRQEMNAATGAEPSSIAIQSYTM